MDNTKVKVFTNLCDDVIEFETVEDFDNYYRKNKELVDNLSTRGLNQKFKIKGHHIGRLKNVITLYPLKQSKVKENDVQTTSSNEENLIINEKLNSLNNRLKNIEENFLEFIDAFYDFLNDCKPQQPIQRPVQQQKSQQPMQRSMQPVHSMSQTGFSTFGL